MSKAAHPPTTLRSGFYYREFVMYETKVCAKCGEDKPLSEYHYFKSGYYRISCKACHRAKVRADAERKKRSAICEKCHDRFEYFGDRIRKRCNACVYIRKKRDTTNSEHDAISVADTIRARINKYPPRIRPLMLKQAEMYALGEYAPTTIHSTGMK